MHPVESPHPPAEQRSNPRGPAASTFVPGLVHELRNFMFGLSGSLDAFHARYGALEGVERYEAVMRASLERLAIFLDEMDAYGDPRPLRRSSRSLQALLREAAELLEHRAAAGGAEIALELDPALPPVLADEDSLRMAFVRLLGVALGEPVRPGRVTVRAQCRPGGGAPAIAGQVQGAGLDLAGLELSRLFEPFYVRTVGFGRLALPVARRILEHHGGSLAASAGPAGELRLAFTLPGD